MTVAVDQAVVVRTIPRHVGAWAIVPRQLQLLQGGSTCLFEDLMKIY